MDIGANETRKENEKNIGNLWGGVVCLGTMITFIGGIGHVNSFGLVYNDFMVATQSSAKSITTAHGIFAVMLAVGGIILDVISKKCSLRIGGILGAIIMITGSLLTVFITNTYQLSVTFGVLQGIGFGMMVPVCYSTLNFYFKKRRTTVMSICKAVQGIVLMFWPYSIRSVMQLYGFRGTLLLICGISMHTLPGMLVMKTDLKKQIKNRTANGDVENKQKDDEISDLLKRDENVIVKDKSIEEVKSNNKGIKVILNLKMLKDPIYCNMCIGLSFVNFSDLTFFILQPLLLFQYGYNTKQIAICISVCGISDVAGRCVLAIISYFLPINTRLLYYVATLFTLFIRIAMLQLRQFHWIVVVNVLLGVLRAWLHISSPLVISNHVAHKEFPGAYALFMLAAGLVNVMCSPMIGQLRDMYQDYVPAFYALTLCLAPCLILWPIEYYITNKK